MRQVVQNNILNARYVTVLPGMACYTRQESKSNSPATGAFTDSRTIQYMSSQSRV